MQLPFLVLFISFIFAPVLITASFYPVRTCLSIFSALSDVYMTGWATRATDGDLEDAVTAADGILYFAGRMGIILQAAVFRLLLNHQSKHELQIIAYIKMIVQRMTYQFYARHDMIRELESIEQIPNPGGWETIYMIVECEFATEIKR
ncbi:hypothetical protein ACJX0J_005551 [Zea mays]